MAKSWKLAAKLVRSALVLAWIVLTVFLAMFFWSEWDHSAARQRLASCVYALNSDQAISGTSHPRQPAFLDVASNAHGVGLADNWQKDDKGNPLRSPIPHDLSNAVEIPGNAMPDQRLGRNRPVGVPALPTNAVDVDNANQGHASLSNGRLVGIISSPAQRFDRNEAFGVVPLPPIADNDDSAGNVQTPISGPRSGFQPDGSDRASSLPDVSDGDTNKRPDQHTSTERGDVQARTLAAVPVPLDGPATAAGREPFLLTLILSASGYRDRREAARLIWSQAASIEKKEAPPIPIVYKFICGLSDNTETNTLTRHESAARGDILIADIADSYKALARKVLWGFRWAKDNVRFRYLLKTDDDVFVNVQELFFSIFLPLNTKDDQTRYYGGFTVGRYKAQGVAIKRNPRSKWYVPRLAYSPDRFPPYNQGHGYILSRDLVDVTLAKASGRQVIDVEDAYVGILMHESKVKPVHNAHIYDRLTRTACGDRQVILIGWVQPRILLLMVDNKQRGRPICHGIEAREILEV